MKPKPVKGGLVLSVPIVGLLVASVGAWVLAGLGVGLMVLGAALWVDGYVPDRR